MVKLEEVKTKKEAIEWLEQMDHAILWVAQAEKVAGFFNVNPPVENFHEGTGRVEVFDGEAGQGVSAHILAETIADNLKLQYPYQHGIGSRLRVACDAILEHLSH